MSSLSFASSLLIPLMIPWKCARVLHRVNLQFRVVAQKVHEELAEAEGLLLVEVDQGLGERRHQAFESLSFLSLPVRGQSSLPGHWRRKAAQPASVTAQPDSVTPQSPSPPAYSRHQSIMYFRIISLHIIARSQLADYRNKPGTNIGKPVFMDDPRKSFASWKSNIFWYSITIIYNISVVDRKLVLQ